MDLATDMMASPDAGRAHESMLSDLMIAVIERFTPWRSFPASIRETNARSGDWRHPVVRTFDPPDVLPTGTHLAVECRYDNGVDRPVRLCDGQPCALRLGESADDAMCGVVGYAVEP